MISQNCVWHRRIDDDCDDGDGGYDDDNDDNVDDDNDAVL